jgi:V/A-type H+-transporting ATPase subunit C
MMRRLFSPNQVRQMLERPLSEQAGALESAHLASLELGVPPHPGWSLEQRILSTTLQELLILVRPLSGLERQFLLRWASRLELSNLKAILRGKFSGRSVAAIREDLVDMGPFTTLPLESLLRTEDFSELLRQLEATPYADIARRARNVFEERRELFAIDAAVDHHFWVSLLALANRVEETEGESFRELLASIVDRINLVWLLRYRFVYGLPPAQAFYLLIPSSYHLTTGRLAELVKLESLPAVLEAVPPRLRGRLEGASLPFEVTQRLEQATYDAAYQALRHAASALSRAFAYLVAREFDLRKVRAIYRAQMLHLDPAIAAFALGLSQPAAVHD